VFGCQDSHAGAQTGIENKCFHYFIVFFPYANKKAVTVQMFAELKAITKR
jgi:hypothetical protein